MHLTPEQREQVIAELTKDPNRLDSEIGEILRVPSIRVGAIRRQRGFANYSYITRRKMLIQAELKNNPSISNMELARKHKTTAVTVARYREQVGVSPAPRGSAGRPLSEGTMKCRAMLLDGTHLPDIHIAKVCGISFAHVARQRDLLGLPRSSRSNRLPTGRATYDFSVVDEEIRAGELTLVRIAEKHRIPVSWVTTRSTQVGGRINRISPDVRKKIEDVLKQEKRPTTTVIGEMFGVSSSTVNAIRREIGVRRLPPGLPKYEETKRATVLLSGKKSMTLKAIAHESGLTVATVTKIRDRMIHEGKLKKPAPKK